MNEMIIQRLKSYDLKTAHDEQNSLKEIAQEIILYALSETDFFHKVYFCGGTALRIVHGLNRFSEDLDFTTKIVLKDFDFNKYLEPILSTLSNYGLDMVVKKTKDDGFIKAREFKEDSDKWKISFPSHQKLKKVIIKLEIDTNPPAGATDILATLDFPILHQIKVANLETLFAGKIHALLCRNYVKGRDWYDLLWYLKNGTKINFEFLKNALKQIGPFTHMPIDEVNQEFVIHHLIEKIEIVDWSQITLDVQRFLKQEELSSLKLWGKELFREKVSKLSIIRP